MVDSIKKPEVEKTQPGADQPLAEIPETPAVEKPQEVEVEKAEGAMKEKKEEKEKEVGAAPLAGPSVEVGAASVTGPDVEMKSKDPLIQEIENIMTEDLTDVFLKLPPDKQKEFKLKGEETAGKIKELLAQTKKQAKNIFDLIREWLLLLPGMNRIFLEQESKIKTDRLIILAEEEKRRAEETIS